jgi:hypothetical protein
MSERKPGIMVFADEAGYRGAVRDLTAQNDREISLICTLAIPAEYEDMVRTWVQPLYDHFRSATPTNAVLHISDAFKRGNESWGAVAATVRHELFALMCERGMIVIYVARRAALARKLYEDSQALKREAQANKTSKVKTVGANRPDDTRIEDEVMISLALMLDTFAEQEGGKTVDIKFDQLDAAVARRYEDALEITRNVSRSAHVVKGWDPKKREKLTGQIDVSASASFELDSKFLGKITVAGKDDPLVFAADVVANSLWRHLSKLHADAKLNAASSVSGWEAESLVWGKDHDKGFDSY